MSGVLDVAAMSSSTPEEHARFFRPAALPGVETLHATFVRHRYPAHIHDSWVVACVDRGAASFELDGTLHTAPSGSVFVIPPGIVHTGEPATDGGYTYRVLYIDWAAVDDDAAGWSNEPWPWSSPITHDRDCLRTVNQLHELLALSGRALEQGEALAALRSALRGVAGLHPRSSHAQTHPAVARARAFTDEHWRENFTLRELAEAAEVSPFYLVRTFHREVGMPPAAYRRALRVQAAQKLLRRGEPLRDVALTSGFYDQAHLTRHFKAVTGVTPMRYRDGT
jgi:AraC-like DNA-binding protein